jgi:hypothetical protein
MQIMSRASVGVFVGIAALIVASAARAQAPEPIVGTWKLDVAKSTYKPGPAPKTSTLVIEPVGKGIKVAVDAVQGDGTPLKWGFTSLRDGKEEAPVTGNPMFDAVLATRTNAYDGTNVYKKAGKQVMTTHVSISADGKVMTLKSSGTDAKGQAIQNVAVYTK